MSKSHAEHNESLCHTLLADKNYNDWVITTAFYSVLHYTEYQLFPLLIGAVTYNSFNHYYDSVLSKSRVSKHNGKSSLVNSNLTCGSQYRWLMDACMNARYINYIVDEPTAKFAKNCLDTIKSCITKP